MLVLASSDQDHNTEYGKDYSTPDTKIELEANAPRRATKRPSTLDLASIPQKRLFRNLKIHLGNNKYVHCFSTFIILICISCLAVIINLER